MRAFLKVSLPQVRLPLLGGALLVGLHLLAEYGAFAMLRFDTFTTAIFSQYRSTFTGPAASMLAGVLVLCCLGLLLPESLARGHARYARLGRGAPRPVALMPLGGMPLWLLLPRSRSSGSPSGCRWSRASCAGC